MSPGTRNGGPPAGPAAEIATATNRKHDPRQRTATVQEIVAFATLFLAAGDARLDWLVVKKCPLCGHAHRHIRFEVGASTVTRAPACARHRTYRVTVSDVVPSAAERRVRGRGAA